MSDEDALLDLVRTKACAEAGDASRPTATADEIRSAEARLGFAMHPLHARLLREVADGGFGPGTGGCYGVGANGGRDECDEHLGGDAVEVRATLAGAYGNGLPLGSVPLADLGCGCWALVDAASGRVLAIDEHGVVETELDIDAWFRRWAAGETVEDALFDQEKAPRGERINPFTRQLVTFVGRGPLKGRRILSG